MKKLFISLLSLLAITATAQVGFGDAVKFNQDWLFQLGDDSLAVNPSFDDSKWRHLDLPHDWSVEGRLSPTLASCTGYYPGGIAWYRKHFVLAANDLALASADQQALPLSRGNEGVFSFIYFEGIYNRSTVYLNGHLLGYRPSGFASFLYDMTPYLKAGDNVLAVRVDHSRYADCRWYTGSGIYRDVWYVEAPKTHLAQWGTGWVCSKLTDASAKVDVDVAIDNAEGVSGLKLQVELLDANGRVVAQKKVGAKAVNKLSLNVARPHRWDLKDPYLYKLRTTLFKGNQRIDGNEINVGLRSLQFDANKGFALNGRWMKVKGVCLHHDAGTLGAAVPDDVWRRRLENLKLIGVNAIRCAHNPQAPILYDLCDELGLLVMDEASDAWEFPKRKWVEGWNVGTPSFDGTYDFFEEWIDRDVTDMVRRDRNHPSIFLWSIGNEVDYPNDPYSHPVLDGKNSAINQPMFGGYDPTRPNAERIGKIAKRLAACVRAVDTSRPVTGALAGVVMSNETEYPDAVDVVGYNYTENRYAEDHATYPNRVIYGSENGTGYDAWKAVRDNEYIFGQFIWTGTDYLGESGRWPSRGLHTGLLDFGSFPKPRGWFRASLWCEEPVCYIGSMEKRLPRRWRNANLPPREFVSPDAPDVWNYEAEGTEVRVFCYTNCPQARLLLNGKEVGEMKPREDKEGIIFWDVPYTPGQLKAEACDAQGNVQATYVISTSGRPYQIRAVVDKAEIGAVNHVAHITVEVLDEDGNVVKLADNNIRCEVEGPARLLGLEGSDNSDMGDYRDNLQRVYMGRLLAYIGTTGETGRVTVRFTSPLLKSAEASFDVQ